VTLRSAHVSDGTRFEFREAVVGAVTALVTEAANFFLFDHSEAGSVLAIAIAVVGLLLSVMRQSLQVYFSERFSRIDKLAQITGLSLSSDVASVSDLLRAYLAVGEQELSGLKQEIVVEATTKLRRLAMEKRSALLSADLYAHLFQQLDNCRSGDHVHAVSLSSEVEWNDSQVERNYLEKNREAAGRGVEVSRIFVVESGALSRFLSLPAIVEHTVESTSPLRGYFVSRGQLEHDDRELLMAIGEGFIDFNGRVAFEDRFDPAGRVRGVITVLPADLERMRSIYGKLQNMAVPLSRGLAPTAS